MGYTQALPARLRALRQSSDLTQAELAKRLGCAESTVRMWELGRNEPDLATINTLAELFNVPFNYLVGKDDENTLSNVYFNFARHAQENEIDPADIQAAIDIIKKFRGV